MCLQPRRKLLFPNNSFVKGAGIWKVLCVCCECALVQAIFVFLVFTSQHLENQVSEFKLYFI